MLSSRKLTFVLPAHRGLFNFYSGPSAIQLLSATPVASQQPVCVTLHMPALARHGLPAHSDTCSRDTGVKANEHCLRKCLSLVLTLFRWRFCDVLGNLIVQTGLHLKQSSLDAVIQNIFQPPALYALKMQL